MPEQSYTKEELDDMGRVQLRRLVTNTYGMDNKKCTNCTSVQLKEYILEAQEGDTAKGSNSKGGNGTSAHASKAAASKTGRASKATSSRGSRTTRARTTETKKAAAPEAGDVSTMVDAIGKTVDENHNELKGEIGELKETLNTILDAINNSQRSGYLTFGVLSDVHKVHFEPNEYDERVDELSAEWDAEGNA